MKNFLSGKRIQIYREKLSIFANIIGKKIFFQKFLTHFTYMCMH